MKKIFLISQVLLGVNTFMLIVMPFILSVLSNLFPNFIDSDIVLSCIGVSLWGIYITAPFGITMLLVYTLHLRYQEKKDDRSKTS
ncbi:hypothetical protein EM4838_07765 [Enterococcus mundtii]|uniref:Uncharacterized protein n=1 Tax=Enterococcus mundtii TaxID=53346 RepID=A0ABQ0VBQ1_ENTMU|nr:hypothetical protein EM4838_07765 [Enterococcus mundtii]PTO38071.1 hypothetical protein C6P50_12905 [Enterococcus mundtii]RYT04237.1 hypothetical protein EAI87_06980 [Enterococcus mundtii]GEL79907.1 hypothetical protein EMU01_10510 [Enterococcus mundtii]GEN17481.1 hypothetical protein LAC02_07620 [Ligilactobacillus acidipiscis]